MPNSRFLKNLTREENRPVLIVVLALVVIQAVLFSYLLLDFKTSQKVKTDAEESANISPEKITEKPAVVEPDTNSGSGPQVKISTSDPKVAAIIEKVFKHIFLPSGDVRIETVVKPDELRKANPVFYQFAKTGDQILIYPDRAILYDPVADKVLDVMHASAN